MNSGTSISSTSGQHRGAAPARLLVLVAVLITFAPRVRHDFGGVDDDMNVARNPHLNPPAWRGVAHYWRTPAFDLYVPFTYTVWSAAARVAWLDEPDPLGRWLNPHVFHLLNVSLHALAALAAFEVLRRCVGGAAWPACAGALVFALHPVQVEPVGWVAGMKDVLAGMLALIALWQYLRAGEAATGLGRAISWTAGTVAFVLAMLSKPSAVIVPAVAFVLDWLVVGRTIRAAASRALPWLLLALPFMILARRFQPAPFIGDEIPLHLRPLVATDALAFYLYKLVWPLRLGVDYGRTPQAAIANGWVWWTWVAPLAGGVVAWRSRRRAPILSAAMLIFVAALAPVLGVVPFDFQAYSTVADHYLYLAMLGPALAAAWAAARWPRAGSAVVFVVAGALAFRSLAQARHWRDALAIFSHAIDVNPRSWVSHARLAEYWAERHDYARAADEGRRAARINPRAWSVHRTLGAHLAATGRADEAIEAYRAALALAPDDAHANTNLANLYASRKQYAEAIRHYETALRRVPYSVIVHTNLASVLEETGRLDEALAHYRKALEINPAATNALDGLRRVERAKSTQPTTR